MHEPRPELELPSTLKRWAAKMEKMPLFAFGNGRHCNFLFGIRNKILIYASNISERPDYYRKLIGRMSCFMNISFTSMEADDAINMVATNFSHPN